MTYDMTDDIGGLTGDEQELANLVNRLDKTSSDNGMEINAEKTKLTTKWLSIKNVTLGGGVRVSGYGALHGGGSVGGVLAIVTLRIPSLLKLFFYSSSCQYQIDNIDVYASFAVYFN